MRRTKADRRDRGYGERKHLPLASRHDRHEVKVAACPRCSPLAVGDLTGGKQEEATA